MKKLLLVIFTVFLLNNTGFAGSLKIERIWVDGDYAYALVTYTNDTDKTFERGVTIKCSAIDHSDNKININTRSFFTHEYGPIKPRFEDTLKIPVELHGASMKSMSCNVRER